jgi:hypothetical protein
LGAESNRSRSNVPDLSGILKSIGTRPLKRIKLPILSAFPLKATIRSTEKACNITMTKSLNIIICGAGLGGLGAAIALVRKGHRVIVLEAASKLNEVGAGIQIPPNSTRILQTYELEEKIREKIVWPSNINFRRYATGDVIGTTPLDPVMSEKYGYP